MLELEELNRDFTRQFDEKRPPAKMPFPMDSGLSAEDRKIADILKFKGKQVTVFRKQKYGYGFLEGSSDAVLVDCDSLGVILKFAGSNDEMSFSLNQVELSRDMVKKRLKLTILREERYNPIRTRYRKNVVTPSDWVKITGDFAGEFYFNNYR